MCPKKLMGSQGETGEEDRAGLQMLGRRRLLCTAPSGRPDFGLQLARVTLGGHGAPLLPSQKRKTGEEPEAHWERGLDGPALAGNTETRGDQAPGAPRMGLGTDGQELVTAHAVGGGVGGRRLSLKSQQIWVKIH